MRNGVPFVVFVRRRSCPSIFGGLQSGSSGKPFVDQDPESDALTGARFLQGVQNKP